MDVTRRGLGPLALGAAASVAMSESDAAEALANVTDCHVHIIGPQSKYPFIEKRAYTPP